MENKWENFISSILYKFPLKVGSMKKFKPQILLDRLKLSLNKDASLEMLIGLVL